MGEPHQFQSPFPTQPSTFPNDPRIVVPNQEPATSQAPPLIFPTQRIETVFGYSPHNVDSSGKNIPESSVVQNPSNLFLNPVVKSSFGLSSQTTESVGSKQTIFGGSAFPKSSDSMFAASGKQNIFGGSLNNPQAFNVPKTDGSVSQTNVFGQPQLSFGGASSQLDEEGPSTQSNIFRGSSASSQASNFKSKPFDNVNLQAGVQATSSKPSIFGGSYVKKDDMKLPFPPYILDKDLDLSGPSGKLPLFSSSNSAFGRFSTAASSTLPNHTQETPSTHFSPNDIQKKSEEQALSKQGNYQTADWEPDSIREVNQEVIQQNENIKSTKKIRKHGVFGKALEDMAKTSSRNESTEETRSIVCYAINDDLTSINILKAKAHFAQFGVARVTPNYDKNYVVVTYKTHQEAAKAMEGGHTIDGTKYKFFWRNLAKARRKSLEDIQQKPAEEKRRSIKRSEIDMDDDVREELAAISDIDYLIPEDVSSKRKSIERDLQKKSRSRIKTDNMDLGAHEGKEESYESQKRNISLASRSEGIKDRKSRAVKVSNDIRPDEKSSLRSRIGTTERISSKKSGSHQPKDEADEAKQENLGNSTQVSATAVTSELLETLKQQAVTSEEKLRVLEARDKLIRLKQVKQYDISKAVKTVGTCPDMCPEKERLLRETRRQISQYEMNFSKVTEMDPSRMVKQYSRSSADQEEPLPHDLRPPEILTLTMNYLMHTIMNLGDEPGENLGDWYHFLWDRLRGIRKEITQQELCDADTVRLVEQCARFHIHCGARLVSEDMSVFDDRINTENLTKCLQTLKHMYQDLWMNSSITCKNEPEFITYFLLLNLNNGTIMWEMEQLREEVLRSPEIGFVAAMYNSLSSNNFIRFFRLVRKASYLNSCLCIRYFYQVRAKALSTYIKALAKTRPVQYPLSSFIDGLGFENADQATAFCNHHGLQVENSSLDSNSVIILSQETFDSPSFVLASERAFGLAESKKFGSVGEVVYGGPLPPRLYENHIVHESFDKNGYLQKSAFYAKDQGLQDMIAREEDDNICTDRVELRNKQPAGPEAVKATASVMEDTREAKKTSSLNFGSFGNTKFVLPASFSNTQTGNSTVFNRQANEMFKTAFMSSAPLQTPSETMKSNITPVPGMPEPTSHTGYQFACTDQMQAKIEADKKAQAELEKTINECSEFQMQELLKSSVQEATAEIALSEWKVAEEQHHAEERLRAEEQLRAQEELRRRVLETLVDKISNDSLCELINEIVEQLVYDSAQDAYNAEIELVGQIKMLSEDSLESLIHLVAVELCSVMASEELKRAQESARQEAVKHRVRRFFYYWLKRARCSLQRKRVMKDFPASVIQLSVKEHAERWGISANVHADVWESCSKSNENILDIPELKAIPAYPQTTFAELIGIQAVHRYDTVRTKLNLRPTDKLLYKLFVSVPEEFTDPATQLIDWWIRRTFKQNCSMLCDDVKKGVYRVVSGIKVTSEVAVYASIQMVRGPNPLEEQIGLASGTSAVLFTVSPTSNIEASRARLTVLLKSIYKLPAVPLVVAVVSPSEPPIEGLKQLVSELELDQWLHQDIISDYQILHVEELFDLKYLSERFSMTFNYMVMTWTPTAEFSLVCLKNVLRSTFQMFYISIQFNYNSSEVYPRDIDDPRVIIGLCNEWLDHMCNEFVSSYHEARYLCGEEFWPLLHKGAYLPFLNKPRYEHLLQEVIRAISLPLIEWPPSSEEEFETMLSQYCSWLRPDEWKQTLRRLSCLNGLTWPEKMKMIPWVNLIEDWMEARINYIETSVICGTELLCLMRAQNVEHLYTYPWWAQSKHIISYLESTGSGWDCDMDVDQTVPIENTSLKEINTSQDNAEKKEVGQPSLTLDSFQDVVDCVSELKKVNESLMTRLHTALVDDAGAYPESRRNIESEPARNDVAVVAPNPESEMKNIDLLVKAHQDLRSNISNLLSKALDEDDTNPSRENVTQSESIQPNSTLSELTDTLVLNNKGTSKEGSSTSSKKMDEIMASANDIVSSLNHKYKILDTNSQFTRISDLKMGFGKVDTYSHSDKLDHSAFVEQSQQRMMERLQGSISKKTRTLCEKSKPYGVDYDSDILSDERSASTEGRTASSPSSLESESVNSISDGEDNEFSNGKAQHHTDESEDENYPRSKKRQHSNDSDDDSYSDSRTRRHCNDSESDNYSVSRVHLGQDVSEDNDHSGYKSWEDDRESEEVCSNSAIRRHHLGSEDEESYHDRDGSADEEEIQTISSEESQESPVHHINLNAANNESLILHNDNPFSVEENQPSSNCDVFDGALTTHNGLVINNNSDAHLINLDHADHYEYFGNDTGVLVEDPVYTVSSEADVLHAMAPSEAVVSNCDTEPVSEENDHILLSSEENDHVLLSSEENDHLLSSSEGNDHVLLPNSDATEQNVYEVEGDSSDQDCVESAPDCSEDAHRTTSDDEDGEGGYDQLRQQLEFKRYSRNRGGDSGSDIEEYGDLEEEEDDGEGEAECGEEEEADEAEPVYEDDEEEAETEVESEPEDDSDVCEVIDDD